MFGTFVKFLVFGLSVKWRGAFKWVIGSLFAVIVAGWVWAWFSFGFTPNCLLLPHDSRVTSYQVPQVGYNRPETRYTTPPDWCYASSGPLLVIFDWLVIAAICWITFWWGLASISAAVGFDPKNWTD
jgi:hypothetical protein